MSFCPKKRIFTTTEYSHSVSRNGHVWLAGSLITLLLGSTLALPVQAYDLHDNTGYHNRQGEFLLSQQQFGAALDEFRAAISLNPGITMEAAFQNNLGISYLGMAKSAESLQPQKLDRIRATYYPLAINAFLKACQLAPNYALYRHNLIRAHAMAGQLEDYEHELLTIVVETPTNAESWFLLGLLYRRQNDAKRARPCFINYIKLQPGSEMARAARQFLKEHPEEEGGEHGEGKESEHGEHKAESHKEGEPKGSKEHSESHAAGGEHAIKDHDHTRSAEHTTKENAAKKETAAKEMDKADGKMSSDSQKSTSRSTPLPPTPTKKTEGNAATPNTAPLTLPHAKANPPGSKAPKIKQPTTPVIDATDDIPELRKPKPKHPADKGIKPFQTGNRKSKN